MWLGGISYKCACGVIFPWDSTIKWLSYPLLQACTVLIWPEMLLKCMRTTGTCVPNIQTRDRLSYTKFLSKWVDRYIGHLISGHESVWFEDWITYPHSIASNWNFIVVCVTYLVGFRGDVKNRNFYIFLSPYGSSRGLSAPPICTTINGMHNNFDQNWEKL